MDVKNILKVSTFFVKNGMFTNRMYMFLVEITEYVRFLNRKVIGSWRLVSRMLMMTSNVC